MRNTRRTLTSSAAGVVFGAVAIVILTAILTGAVTGYRADARTADLVGEVQQLRQENAGLRTDLTAAQVAAAREREQAARQIQDLLATNRTLVSQNHATRAQLTALVDYLHAHGLAVPQVLTTAPEDRPRPKARPTEPGPSPSPSPSPTPPAPGPTPGPSPTPGPPDGPLELVCSLVPLLCLRVG